MRISAGFFDEAGLTNGQCRSVSLAFAVVRIRSWSPETKRKTRGSRFSSLAETFVCFSEATSSSCPS